MTTSERIAAAIKPILDEDRRADRVRIADLERDNNAVVQCCAELREAIDVYLAEIQRLTEKCAALVVERDFYKGAAPSMLQAAAPGSAPHTTGGLVDHAQEMMKRGISPELARAGAAFLGAVGATTLRIDTDMSDPQPGKLLVVRLNYDNALRMLNGHPVVAPERVGFLVETPAVEVKEQGPWVVYDEGCTESDLKWRTAEGWFFRLVQPKCFPSREDAQEAIRDFGAGAKSFRIITLAEARAIEAKR